ncbi:hypothetical protein M0802_003262 [Mischocyttarus mexicanus]|nr:hypothetical protein M0802_003262 [Mischocyttarus mexicanus]
MDRREVLNQVPSTWCPMVNTCTYAYSLLAMYVNSETSMGIRGWRERRTKRAIDPFYSNPERDVVCCVLLLY